VSKVNFFIVGAPKSGTTSLYTYLSTHPDIFFPSHKEPNFFAEDYPNMGGRLKTKSEYEKLFASYHQKLAGDASVCYLSSDTAPQAIQSYNPHAKIIIMLRNPIDLFISEHSQLLYSFYENIQNPFEAWQMQPLRKRGEHIPASCREPQTLQYKKVCVLGRNLQKYRKIFAENKILTLFFEDFICSPQTAYQTVLHFLELEDDGRQDFPKVNEAKYHKRNWLSKWLISPPGIWGTAHSKIRQKVATSDSVFIKSIEDIARKLTSRNSIKKTSYRLSQDEFHFLLSELSDDIDLLASLTGRKLSHWKTNTP
jgi:Sulfotransferase domain